MLDQSIYIKLGNILLEKLKGKLNLKINLEERYSLAELLLHQIIQSEEHACYRPLYEDSQQRHEFLKRFFSYDEIEEIIRDPKVEDIAINGVEAIFLHHTQEGLIKTNKSFHDFEYLEFFLKKLIVFSGRTKVNKINDFEMPYNEGRVNVIFSPYGYQITITKMKEKPLTIVELLEKGSLDYSTAGFLWLAIEGMKLRPANLLIVGGPGAGKTTLLNALLSFVPENERVVVIEDTLELNTQGMANFSRLESDENVSLEQLVKNTLRMRPDRLIIGEVRGTEAQDMITAMNIGKYCMGTIHAPNTKEAFVRLCNAPMNIPAPLLNLIDVIVVLRKYSPIRSIQRVVEEISETSILEEKRPLVSVLWKYDYKKKKVMENAPFAVYREKLAEATGKSPAEVVEELEIRKRLLYLLVKKGVSKFADVTAFASLYNLNPQEAMASLGVKMADLYKISSAELNK